VVRQAIDDFQDTRRCAGMLVVQRHHDQHTEGAARTGRMNPAASWSDWPLPRYRVYYACNVHALRATGRRVYRSDGRVYDASVATRPGPAEEIRSMSSHETAHISYERIDNPRASLVEFLTHAFGDLEHASEL